MSITVYTPDKVNAIAEAAATDFGRFAYDGFGIMLSDEQLETRAALGRPGPREQGEFKWNWLSGGQRGGKTVEGFLFHAEAALYKVGVDGTSPRYWRNYAYKTLAIAPSNELTLRLWTIGDEIQKGAHESQYDKAGRHARGGAFLHKFRGGSVRVGQVSWPALVFSNGSIVDFRSSEGRALRLEGGQWWWITWDEWASQQDAEIQPIKTDVLLGRARDHDAKIMPMAWPKKETERHLIAVERSIARGDDRDSQILYLSAAKAFFTNKQALEIELRTKTKAEISRTIYGRPAGGAAIEFKEDVTDNMTSPHLPLSSLREDGFDYFSSWDLGMAHDATVGITWRIPIVGGKRVVSPEFRARIVNTTELPGGDSLTLDAIAYNIAREQQLYRSQTAIDATAMGGVAAFRHLRDLRPMPYGFAARSNDRLWGNMRLAAITNGLDLVSWGRPQEPREGVPWGCIEVPKIVPLLDQLANFDRDAKDVADDWVWAFLIGAWYIRRFWVVGEPGDYEPRPFDLRSTAPPAAPVRRGRGRLIQAPVGFREVKIHVPRA